MENLFFVLVGLVVGFIAYKTYELNRKSETTKGDTADGGVPGTGPDTAGELPKDNKE
jgi:hypothetical protein